MPKKEVANSEGPVFIHRPIRAT